MKNVRKVGVITYLVKHRKTFDVLSLLKANGYKDVVVYALPLHYQKKKLPLIQHRPGLHYCIPETERLCANLGFRYESGRLESLHIEEDRIILVAGAGILPKEFIQKYTLINAHPGYIPNCRGLDAFKWAINDNEPIGVTTHLLGEFVDAGQVIERRKIDVYPTDTFHALAQRVYENEVSMLVEAVEKCEEGSFEMIYPGNYEVHKRMPEDVENKLIDKFEQYKKNYAIKKEQNT